MNYLTKHQADAAMERCEKATKGPWLVRPLEHDDWGIVRGADGKAVCDCAPPGRWERSDCGKPEGPSPIPENTDFVANSITDLPAALAMLGEAMDDVAHLLQCAECADGSLCEYGKEAKARLARWRGEGGE